MQRGTQSRGRRHGVTYLDLIAILVIVCMLSAMAFSESGLLRARETANRVKCMSNLRQLGMAAMMYSNDNRGVYPRTVWKTGDAPTQYTGVECKDPFGKEGAPKPNDVTATLFLLLRSQDLASDMFICPSTDAVKFNFGGGKKSAQDLSNFPSEANLSYSISNPFPGPSAIATGYKWNNTLSAEFPLIADMNPGTFGESDVTPAKGPADEKAPQALLDKGNSVNHRGRGQNILFGDGHVAFSTTPFAGMHDDNIYTVAGDAEGKLKTSATISGLPMSRTDSVMLPATTANPHKTTPLQDEMAALEEFKNQLPEIKRQIIEAETKSGETAETKRAKMTIEAIERAVADTNAKSGK